MTRELQAQWIVSQTFAFELADQAGNIWNGTVMVAKAGLSLAQWHAAIATLPGTEDTLAGGTLHTGRYICNWPAALTTAGTYTQTGYGGSTPSQATPTTNPVDLYFNGTAVIQNPATDLAGNALGTAAAQTTILSAVNGITTNTVRSRVIVGSEFVQPTTGTNAYTILLYLYNDAGVLEDPDSNAVTIAAGSSAFGTQYNGLLGSTSMTRHSTGTYTATFTVNGLDQTTPTPVGDAYFGFAWSKTELVSGSSTAEAMAAAATVPIVSQFNSGGLVTVSSLTSGAISAIQSGLLTSTDSRLPASAAAGSPGGLPVLSAAGNLPHTGASGLL